VKRFEIDALLVVDADSEDQAYEKAGMLAGEIEKGRPQNDISLAVLEGCEEVEAP
jgi:hypothetical protein